MCSHGLKRSHRAHCARERHDSSGCVTTDKSDNLLIGRCSVQFEFVEESLVPSVSRWRLTDHDHTTRPNTSDRCSQSELRGSKATGNGGIKVDVAGSDCIVDVSGHDAHSARQAEAPGHLGEKIGAFGPPIEQRDSKVRTINGEHEPGDTAAGAEIDHRTRYVLERPYEAPGMLDDFRNGSVTQKAEALGSSQRLVQFFFDLGAGSLFAHDVEYVRT